MSPTLSILLSWLSRWAVRVSKRDWLLCNERLQNPMF